MPATETCSPVDIRSNQPFPVGALSNLARHHFVFRDQPLVSMEGLLQGLKHEDVADQRRVHGLWGGAAKRGAKGRQRGPGQPLWWLGTPIDRFGPAYQAFLDEAYDALFTQSGEARAALLATGTAPLVHTIGKTDPTATILTVDEFCARLTAIRGRLAA